MKKTVLIDGHRLGGEFKTLRKVLEDAGIEFVVQNFTSEEEVISNCKDADALITVYMPLTKKITDSMENAKVYVRTGIGFDAIDIPAATAKKIAVCNIPDYCVPEVATHAMALILSIERKISYLDTAAHKGSWNANSGYSVHRLSHMTLGLVGFGNIARQAAAYAKVFGLNLVAYDPYLSEEVFEKNGAKKVELDELFKLADIISVHVPLNAQTKHLINKDSFVKMKDGVIIINTSRGPLVCENDLIEALKSGKVKAAGLDVTESEPINDPSHPLLQLDNVVVTPHAAYNSVEASDELEEKIGLSIVRVLNGEIPYNVLNKKDLA